MRFAILFLMLGMSFVGCSKSEKPPPSAGNSLEQNAPAAAVSEKGGTQSNFESAGIEDLRTAAEAGVAPAQRELAARMLFGKGMAADPAGALVWVERAARGGDTTATLWMGRKFLNEPPDRVAAGAWFLLAAESGTPAVKQDAAGELEALALSAVELDQARTLKAKLKTETSRSSK